MQANPAIAKVSSIPEGLQTGHADHGWVDVARGDVCNLTRFNDSLETGH